MRLIHRIVVASLFGLLLLIGFADRASAHAVLESTQPAANSSVDAPVANIILQFDENVQAAPGSIRIYNSAGARITSSSPHHQNDDGSSVAIKPGSALRSDTYVVAWRVVSADSHPVHGAFSFTVGANTAADTDSLSERLLNANGGSKVVGSLFAADRFVSFLAGALFAGSAVVLFWLWPAGLAVSRTKRYLRWVGIAALIATVLGILLQGIYQQALSLSSIFDSTVLSEVIRSKYGYFNLLRMIGIVLLAVVVSRPLRMSWKIVGSVAAALVVVPWSFVGHASTEVMSSVAIAVDALHVSAVSIWLGGLVVLAAIVLPKAADDELRRFASRFSKVAIGCVIAILVTGSYRAWREIGAWSALTSTEYGRLLIIKIFLFAALISLGSWSRRFAAKRWNGEGLRRSVRFEIVLIVLTLLASSFLVQSVPPRVTPKSSYSTELTNAKMLLDFTVDPTNRGPTEFHFYVLTPAGAVMKTQELTATLSLASKDLGPLPIEVRSIDGSHYISTNASWPLAGVWTLDVAVRISDVDQINFNTEIKVQS